MGAGSLSISSEQYCYRWGTDEFFPFRGTECAPIFHSDAIREYFDAITRAETVATVALASLHLGTAPQPVSSARWGRAATRRV